MAGARPLVKVILEKALIERGGDIGAAEIYFEGWIDDGAGTRRTFRIPHAGHIPGVKDGQTLQLDALLHESLAPVGDELRVHIEAWDEDLGRNSLLDPDDLLGVYEEGFGPGQGWGSGRHDDLLLKTDQGAWRLFYRIETCLPLGAADDDAELPATD